MEDTIKKYITSLLTSAPCGLQMFALQKDYENTIGEQIPYQKLGYNSLEHFLQSIPDTLSVKGVGREAVLIPVITEKSAHINNLVAKQKVNKKGKNGPTIPRKFVERNSQGQNSCKKIHYPHRPAENIAATSSKLHAQETKTNLPTIKAVTENTFISKENRIQNNFSNSGKPVDLSKVLNTDKEILRDCSSLENKREIEYLPNNTSFTTSNTKYLRGKLSTIKSKKNTTGLVEQNGFVNEATSTCNTSKYNFQFGVTKKGGIVDNLFDNNQENINNILSPMQNVVPYNIQNNLKKLISRYPEGVWCAELPTIYRRMFNKDLQYHEYGFRSLIELCTSLRGIFHYARPCTDDFRLYDRNKPLPRSAEKKFTVASYSAGETFDNNTALPSIDWYDVLKFFPKDIFPPGAEIPRVFVPESTKEYDVFGIVAAEIYDVSKFWVFLDDGKLDQLMDDMQEFYISHHNEYYIPENVIREGLYCVQVIFGEYHRALVIDILPEVEGMIRLLYIDYGTVTKASTKGLCFLHQQFALQPIQAIRCRLANIVPSQEGALWSKECTKSFKKLIAGKTLKATVIKVNWQDMFLDIFMADVTNPDKPSYINDCLVQEGFAQYPDKERKKYKVDSIFKCKVKQIHLFPTFVELEQGLAPSVIEMGVFDECYVPLHFAIPQYFDVDLTAESLRVELTTKEFQRIRMQKRERQINHYDVRQLKPKSINLHYFGSLAKELNELVEPDMLNEEHVLSYKDNKGIKDHAEDFTHQMEIMKCAETLKQDYLLSQDIMRDLDNLGKLDTELEVHTSDKFWNAKDVSGLERNESFQTLSSVFMEYPSNSRSQTTLSDSEKFLEKLNEDFLTLPNKICTMWRNKDCDKNSENTKQVIKTVKKSTNPFLENFDDSLLEVKDSLNNLVLNSNNPFLSNRVIGKSSSSNKSTVSTTEFQESLKAHCFSEYSRSYSSEALDDASSIGQLQTDVLGTCGTVRQTDSLETPESITNSEGQLQSPLSAYSQNWPQEYNHLYGYCNYPLQQFMYSQPMYCGLIHDSRQCLPPSHFNFGSYSTPDTYYTPVSHSSQHSVAGGYICCANSEVTMQNTQTVSVLPPPGFASNSNIYQ